MERKTIYNDKDTFYNTLNCLENMFIPFYRENPNEYTLKMVLDMIKNLEKSPFCECNLKYKGVNI